MMPHQPSAVKDNFPACVENTQCDRSMLQMICLALELFQKVQVLMRRMEQLQELRLMKCDEVCGPTNRG